MRNLTALILRPTFKVCTQNNAAVNRRYFMAARGYEFYLRVLKVSLTSERSDIDTDEIPT